MICAAKQFGDCYGPEYNETVVFKYRNKYGMKVPDEDAQVCMCKTHNDMLKKIYETETLEMRGEKIDWAIYDDLLTPFDRKNNMYTLVKVTFRRETDKAMDEEEEKIKYILMNGRDVEKFRQVMQAGW